MITLLITEGDRSVKLNLPEKVNEISDEYIKEVTKHISVAPYHTLIGLFYKTTLQEFSTNIKNKTGKLTGSVIPIKINSGYTGDTEENEFVGNIPFKSILLVPESSIMIGYTPSVPQNQLNINKVGTFLRYDFSGKKNITFEDGDNFNYQDERMTKSIVLLDFKIIPNTEIKTYYTEQNIDTKLLSFINVE